MACQHNLALTDADGRGCYVCAQNRSMVERTFVLMTGFVGRWTRTTGPSGSGRTEKVLAVAGSNADTAVVTVQDIYGEVHHVRGFDIAFRWYAFHVETCPAPRRLAPHR